MLYASQVFERKGMVLEFLPPMNNLNLFVQGTNTCNSATLIVMVLFSKSQDNSSR